MVADRVAVVIPDVIQTVEIINPNQSVPIWHFQFGDFIVGSCVITMIVIYHITTSSLADYVYGNELNVGSNEFVVGWYF